MRPMLSLCRPAALAAATLLLLTAGCSSDSGSGHGDGDEAGQPGTTAATPSRTAPPPTADAELLASPPGRAIDAWAAAYARAVNKGDHSFAGAADTTPAVRDWMERHAGAEWGRYFPGPLPVAPLGARPVDDTHRDVEACVLVSGWTQESRSVRRTRSREVVGVTFRMASDPAGWRVDRISSAEIDCRGVVPPTRTW